MPDQKHCIRCDRLIDPYARICVYCNWDQDEPVPPPVEQVAPAMPYVPPEERDWRRHMMMGAGAVGLLVAAFAVGSLVHGNDPPKSAPDPLLKKAEAVKPAPQSAVTLVPMTGSGMIDQPITSAPVANPAQGVPGEYQRSDATAVSSAEYAQLAQRAQAEKRMNAIDPRSLTGPAYQQGVPPRRVPPIQRENAPPPAAPAISGATPQEKISIRTRPVPEYQPLPDVHSDREVVARLALTIGADGRVKEVDLREGIPGQNTKIIAAVQSWRFKPATVNGLPVEAPFTVDISFRGQ